MTIGSAANSYEILSKLAEGGMAEIFLARSSVGGSARRYVVLKRIAKSRATDTQYVQMFLDEARLASQLRHPNIAQVFDIGRLGASYFFTMEYVHGVTVQQLVQAAHARGMLLPIGAVLAIVAGTAAGLDHAHERRGLDGSPLGIVHRDVSPSNLLVSYDGHLKIVDFGVAKAMGRPETQAGEIKGKVGYLSPEQCRMQKIDRRSDLYSLGVVMWEMLTLQRLWQRDTTFGTLAAIATEIPRPPSMHREDLPPEIDQLVRQLLTLEPGERFQTAQTVVDAVEQVALRTMTSTTPQQLARLMRELFGSPPEPWHALEEAHEPVSVIATPVPAEESLETFDDEPSASDVEVKLTTVFRAITEEVSSTNVFAVRAAPGEETREVPALARATSIGEAAPLTPPPVVLGPAPLLAPVPPTVLGPLPVPVPPTVVGPVPLPLPLPVPPTVVDREVEIPAPRGSSDPSLSRTMLGTGEPQPPLRLSAPAFAPAPGSGGRPSPMGPPTVPLVVGSGPQPRVAEPRAAEPIIPGSGPQPRPSLGEVAMPPAASNVVLPRWPPPPHGSRSSMHWWVIGGAVLGIGILIAILATRSESTTTARDDVPSDAAVRLVATPPDAGVAAMADASAIGDAVAAVGDGVAAIDAGAPSIDAAAVPIDAAAVTDAATSPAIDASVPRAPKLRTKPELNAAFREKRYTEIVESCQELGAEDDRAVVCTLAACRAHDARAQDWFRNVPPKQRKGTIQICKDSDHVIADVCAAAPDSCRK